MRVSLGMGRVLGAVGGVYLGMSRVLGEQEAEEVGRH